MQLEVTPRSAIVGTAYRSLIASLMASVKPRVLVPMHGSGNYGESGMSAFYTIDEMPKTLLNMTPAPNPLQRTDLDLGADRLAFYVDDVLSADEADALAACADAILNENGNSRLAPGIQTPPGMRVNAAAHWSPSRAEAPSFFDPLLARFRHLVPQSLGGLPLHEHLSEKIAHFKYSEGDRFNRHVDGLFPGQGCNERGDGIDQWPGVQSGMSILFYLNDESDGVVGGQTRLWSADGVRFVDVQPRKGRALFFRRGSADAVLHAGLPIAAGSEPKVMALINLAYGERTGTKPMH